MALANYTDLKAALASWSNRTDLTALIPDFIELAEHRIYKTLRIPPMESVTSYDTNAIGGDFDLPNDLLEIKDAIIQTSTPTKLERLSWGQLKARQDGTSGNPFYFAREGSTLIFFPTPSSAMEVNLYYWKELSPLSDTNLTNWFTTNAPSLLLFGGLLELSTYLHDEEGMVRWEKKFIESVKETQRMADLAEYAGSNLATQTY